MTEFISLKDFKLLNYEISNNGIIRNIKTGKLIQNKKPRKDGYCYSNLTQENGKRKMCNVAFLVAKTFIPNPNNYRWVIFKDKNNTNNNIDNLKWSITKILLKPIKGEVWKFPPKEIKLHNYIVSSEGRIINKKMGKMIKRNVPDGEYLQTSLTQDDGSKKTWFLHRVVAYTFLLNPKSLPEVDHINRNRTDNRSINLKWVTKAENAKNKKTHKTNNNRPIVQLSTDDNFIVEYPSIKNAAESIIAQKITQQKLEKCRVSIRKACVNELIFCKYKWVYKDHYITIEGEEWIDFQYGNITKVSNKGRVYTSGRYTFGSKNNKGYMTVAKGRVNRIVMMAFKPHPNQDKLQVNHKDEIRHNNCLDNLEWMTPRQNTEYSQAKPVAQYDLKGNLIDTFKSVTRGAEATKSRRTAISKCCKGDFQITNNFVWRYIDPAKETPKKIELKIIQTKKRVYQYGFDGKLIKGFDSMTDANKKTGVCMRGIARACKNGDKSKKRTAGGFIWRHYQEGEEIPKYIDPNKFIHKIQQKRVNQYDKNFKLIKTYSSIVQASKSTGIYTAKISKLCRKKFEEQKGEEYRWEFDQ